MGNYLKCTTDNENLETLATESDDVNSNELMERIIKLMNKIQFQYFGKVKEIHGTQKNKELEELYKLKFKAVNENNELEEIEVENKIRKELLELERNEFEKKLKCLADIHNKKGRSAAIFKLKEQILGSKKSGQDAVCMDDPDTGQIIVEKESLKNASVRYVSKLLTNRDPKEEYKAEIRWMKSSMKILSLLRMTFRSY